MSTVPIHGEGEAHIIFDAIPLHEAHSFLILQIVYALCLGMVALDFFSHLGFDYQLIRKPGWTDPAKFVSRSAYLLSRLLPPVFLSLVLVFLTTRFKSCTAVPQTFNVVAMLILDSVALIFVQRTMALYSWERRLVLPLTFGYLVVLALSAWCLPQLGVGVRIPLSSYCAYDTRRNATRTMLRNILYKSSSMLLDLVLLLLTVQRLVEGGLKSLVTSRPRDGIQKVSRAGLSAFLIRQGLHFYALQTATEIVFIVIFFSADEVSYQVLGSALLCTIPPIAAGAAFREMGKKASSVAAKQHVNEIVESSTHNQSSARAGHVSRSDRRRGSTILEEGAHGVGGAGVVVCSVDGLGFNFSAPTSSNPWGGEAAAEKGGTSRVAWGSDGPSGISYPHSHADTHNGVIITVGTVSRSEQVLNDDDDVGWNEDQTDRYSSDLAHPHVMELRRHSLGHADEEAEPARRSSESHRRIRREAASPSRKQPDRASDAASTSPWTPHTPNSPYPTAFWSSYTHDDTSFEPVAVAPSVSSPPVRYQSPPPPPEPTASASSDREAEAPWRHV